MELFYPFKSLLNIGDIPISILFKKIILKLVNLLLVQEHVSLTLWDDDLMVVFDSLPSLSRHNVEELLSIGFEIVC